MFNRSIERDYDINYHRRRIQSCIEEIRASVEALSDVGYSAYSEMDDAEDQMAILKETC